MEKKVNLAVVGATGMVGQKMVEVLVERKFSFNGLKLLASSRSADQMIKVDGKDYMVEELTPQSFDGIDIAFFSAGESISEEYGPEAVKRGAVVIDNSNAFRMQEGVPLVVPEVNPEFAYRHQGIIANPNCSTIQMVVVLQPLQKAANIKRVVASTYQAVSGAGKEAVEELKDQSRDYLEGKPVSANYIPRKGAERNYQIAFNMVPQLDVFVEDGYCKEEMKMIRESRKIMDLPDLQLTATTVRVPVMNGHSMALNVELNDYLSADQARKLLEQAPGVFIIDNPDRLEYPMPLDASGTDPVYVGRIRPDHSVKHGLNLWVVADNIRKGAATNSIQIAELLLS